MAPPHEQWFRRLATFIVLVPLALYMVSSDLGAVLLACGFVAGGSWEYSALIGLIVRRNVSTSRRIIQAVCGTIACLGGAAAGKEVLDASLVVATVVLAATLWHVDTSSLGDATAGGKPLSGLFPRLSLELFGLWYLGWTMGHALLLRSLIVKHQWFMCILITSFVGDTGALVIGRFAHSCNMTLHPLAPRTSPNKTWEGVFGHLAASIGTALCWGQSTQLPPATMQTVVVGMSVSVCCICGDLFESGFKRAADSKDSGSIFPGHGGFLDRLDGLVLAFPVVYYYLVFSK